MNLSRVSQLAILALFCFSSSAMAAPAHAIVEVKTGYVITAKSNGKWLDSAHAAALLPAGTSFRVYGLVREMAPATASKPESVSEPCPDTYSVKLSSEPEEGAIALAASWNALPRKPRVTDTTQPAYVQAVREFLEGQGVKNPKVKITQILRIDLDGDGEEEVLISATNYFTKDGSVPSSTPDGSYSCVLLRRVVAGKVKTQPVCGEFYSKAKHFNAPNRYRILAVLDVDGDGKMEVIVDSAYYEGGATTIYRCTPAKIEELVSTGCGA
ncbi:MAG: hypothetical protein DLM73_11075 [Chthoniobacterales bacterium]|nr:MAG: hypothetical protein DLM73_11075 [Chthoniobacterales bacterium]